ncbi:MAG: HDIG domain-containing metalloprotein [Mobilitalea sp.]
MNVMMDSEKQILFNEITEHLLLDEKPSDYMNAMSGINKFDDYPLKMLQALKKTEQSKKYHPEGNVWNHTMLVLDEAAKVRERSKDAKVFMWAALLHDIGKPDTTRMRKGKITSYDHDSVGEKLCIDFLHIFTKEEDFIQKVSALVKYHMHMLYVLKDLSFGDVKNMLRKVDNKEIALLGRCDRLGRTGVDREAVEAEYQEFLTKIQYMTNY